MQQVDRDTLQVRKSRSSAAKLPRDEHGVPAGKVTRERYPGFNLACLTEHQSSDLRRQQSFHGCTSRGKNRDASNPGCDPRQTTLFSDALLRLNSGNKWQTFVVHCYQRVAFRLSWIRLRRVEKKGNAPLFPSRSRTGRFAAMLS